jgi:hypothetical protein
MTKQDPLTQTPTPTPFVIIKDAPGGGTIKIPLTASYLQSLRTRGAALSDQLQAVDSRRAKLISQLESLGPAGDATAKTGLADRLALLDKRQLQLEADLAANSQELSTLPAQMVANATVPQTVSRGLKSDQIMTLSVLSIVLVWFPLAFAAARGIWKRSNRPPLPAMALTETAQRLTRLEGSVDTIAVEIERISEGQRFVTRLLSEIHPAPLIGGERSREPVRQTPGT